MKIEEIIKTKAPLLQSKKLMLNITYTHSVVTDKFNELLKPLDLSSEQFNVLRILRGQKGNQANMSVIQERMLTKNSNTTRLIDKLLLKDLVTRDVCAQNRRKVEIMITQKGLDTLALLDPMVEAHENMYANNLSSDEMDTLNNLLEKYRTI